MKPYYKTENGRLYCGDCLGVMKELENNSVDLCLTSPPYNMGKSNLGYQPESSVGQSFYGENCNDNKSPNEYRNWIFNVIDECLRISRYVFWNMQFIRSTRNCIFDIQNRYSKKLKDIFIWRKQAVANITGKDGGMAKGWEYVFMLGDNNLSTFKHNNFPKNNYVPNIKTWYKKEYFKEHHATFTSEMCDYFIKYFTQKKDLVYDPFMGTGTVAVISENLERNWAGVEISEKYCETAKKRIQKEANQRKLFREDKWKNTY